MQRGLIETEGDSLYFEVRGSGPPLIMIHGGIVDAGSFARAAGLLATDFTVITYDRRGYSRSTRREPQNFAVSQQARDAVAVLRAAGHAAAVVVGSSGGAIIGLELARIEPGAVTALVAHEPPTMRVLPNAAALQEAYARVYLSFWTEGPRAALSQFYALNPIPRSEADQAAVTPEDLERARGNIGFFLEQEMLPFANYLPDVARIRATGVRVVLGAGELSQEQDPGQAAAILADQLGAPLVIFPGHHISFLGLAEAWVATLREAISQCMQGDG